VWLEGAYDCQDTPLTPNTQGIPSILGSLCQEPGMQTKYILYDTIMIKESGSYPDSDGVVVEGLYEF
jgi:hypothetical protein